MNGRHRGLTLEQVRRRTAFVLSFLLSLCSTACHPPKTGPRTVRPIPPPAVMPGYSELARGYNANLGGLTRLHSRAKVLGIVMRSRPRGRAAPSVASTSAAASSARMIRTFCR